MCLRVAKPISKTYEIAAVLKEARQAVADRAGARVIALANNPGSPLLAAADTGDAATVSPRAGPCAPRPPARRGAGNR